jgi:exosortase
MLNAFVKFLFPGTTGRARLFDVFCGTAVLIILLFGIPYAQGYLGERLTLAHSLRNLWANEQWQHCWLVLPAIGIVVYLQRKQFANLTTPGTTWGLVILILACFTYWAGYRVDNYYLGFLSIQLTVGGLILFLGGWNWLRALAFPYGFLAFVWPLYFLENSITFPLRMLMAAASAGVLNFLGLPVVVQGTGILSAAEPLIGLAAGDRFRVDVADPCSGIRSLFALMMTAALYGHFALRTWWQKTVLFVSSIPLALLGNLARILMLTFGIMTVGPEVAIGKDPLQDPSWFHMLAGYLVFGVAFGGMIVTSLLLATLHDGKFSPRRARRPSGLDYPDSKKVAASDLKDLSTNSSGDLY